MNGLLYFVADDVDNGDELWRSDGTEAGTVLVKDINPSGSSFSVQTSEVYNINGTLFAKVSDGSTGSELWTSDGTSAGTLLVMDLSPGNSSSVPRYLTYAAGKLFFSATEPVHGREPWILELSTPSSVTRRHLLFVQHCWYHALPMLDTILRWLTDAALADSIRAERSEKG